MSSLLILVLLMGIVTYIPRAVPMVMLQKAKLPPRIKRFLEFVPYAVLASLIFPGILNAVNHMEAAVIGGITSVILAFMKLNLMIVVLGGILAVFITQLTI